MNDPMIWAMTVSVVRGLCWLGAEWLRWHGRARDEYLYLVVVVAGERTRAGDGLHDEQGRVVPVAVLGGCWGRHCQRRVTR